MKTILRLMWVAWAFWVCLASVVSQDMALSDLEDRFRQELSKLDDQHKDKERALRGNYLAALLRFERQARQASDLDGVMEARKEIERVEGGATAPKADALSKHPEVSRMQNMALGQIREFNRARAEGVVQLSNALAQFLENGSGTLTQQGKIEEALQWRARAKTVFEIDAYTDAMRVLDKQQAIAAKAEAASPAPTAKNVHRALQGKPTEIIGKPTTEVSSRPMAYWAGNEPSANEKRVTESTPGAAGMGHTFLSGRLKLIDETVTKNRYNTGWSSFREKAHLYVGRVQFAPLPNRNLGKTLVVYDLFKRGSGSKRETIRTDKILLPPVESGQQVVVDSGAYEYDTSKYRSSYSAYRYESATGDEFYGFVVSFFDEEGKLFYQRATEKALSDYARSIPPD